MKDGTKNQAVGNRFVGHVKILIGFVGLFWFLEIIDTFFLNQTLNHYGIQPRTFIGLRGILISPFLHGGLAHLAANTLPFLVLGWLVMLRKTSDFFAVTLITMIVSGLGVWSIGGSNTIHIGASGLVFGYLGFLLMRGFFERSFQAIVIAVTVGVLYGGLIWGILPSRLGISWQSHLFGFIGGTIAARILTRR